MRQCQHLQGQIVPHQLQMTCLGNHVFLLENLPRFISAMASNIPFPQCRRSRDISVTGTAS